MVRSGVSGAAGTVLDLGAMLVFVEKLWLPYALAAALASGVGAVANFALNKWWAFRDPSPLAARQIGLFAAVATGTAAITAGMVHVLAALLIVPYLIAKLAAQTVAFVSWSYPAQARLVFRPRRLLAAPSHHQETTR